MSFLHLGAIALAQRLLLLATLAAAVAASAATECGKRFHDQLFDQMQEWIVGGVTALRGGYPYQASFELYDPWFDQPEHYCGATVVSDKWVITAAHCIDEPKPGNYKVVVGRYNLKKFNKKTRRHNVRRVIVHPKWAGDEVDMSNDIALIELRTPISFNEFVQPACLPDDVSSNPAGLYQPGTPALISGWGERDPKGVDQEDPGRSPAILRAASIPLIEWNACKNANSDYQESVTETMTCAGSMDGGIDSCQGDSGGPLVKIVDGKATLLGVVSWGGGCAQPNYPGIYTNVAYELDFIRQHIKN